MFLKSLSVRNFRCFRSRVKIDLGQATYLVGPNNAGKTALLAALDCFFDSTEFHSELINKSELTARKPGYNRSEIAVTFDLTKVTGRVRKERLMAAYGPGLEVAKYLTWREASNTIHVEYQIGKKNTYSEDTLPEDVAKLIDAVSVSSIHPQEGAELLARAQEKFKQRLFQNWGRHASVAERVKALQEQWLALRATANSYLSSALSNRLRRIWPRADVKVDLPENIHDIVAVSDITFRSSPNLPQISLTSQGTGAQSTILYQTHYVLDSDRTLHQGMYFPVWLLEEPESFLHADLALKMANLLSSDEWLESIQMLISTHSPLILAGSQQASDRTRWVICDSHSVRWQKTVAEVTPEDIAEIGHMLGDSNFLVYMDTVGQGPRLFLEDTRNRTAEKFGNFGISVRALAGTNAMKKYLEVFETMSSAISGTSFFLVDCDDGSKELRRFIRAAKQVDEINGWKKLAITNTCFLVLLPEGLAMEDLFSEWQDILEETISNIFDEEFRLRDAVPHELAQAVIKIRNVKPQNQQEARAILRKVKDVKDRFWSRAEGWTFEERHSQALRYLLLS